MQSSSLNRRFTVPMIVATMIGVGALLTVMRSLTVIPTGEVGLVDFYGQVSDTPLSPGIHLKNPFARIVTFSTQIRELKETVEAPSKDGLTMSVDVSILYRIDPAKAKQLYQTVGANYEQIILVPQFRSLIRGTTANYDAKTLYTSDRQNLAQQLRESLNQSLSDRGVIVEETPLRNVLLPESIQQAVQAKLKAEQESQQMRFVLDKERQEAERKRIEAQGNADAQRILSQGLSDRALQFRQIEATQKLAESPNSKIIVLGGDQKAPMVLQP